MCWCHIDNDKYWNTFKDKSDIDICTLLEMKKGKEVFLNQLTKPHLSTMGNCEEEHFFNKRHE